MTPPKQKTLAALAALIAAGREFLVGLEDANLIERDDASGAQYSDVILFKKAIRQAEAAARPAPRPMNERTLHVGDVVRFRGNAGLLTNIKFKINRLRGTGRRRVANIDQVDGDIRVFARTSEIVRVKEAKR